MTNAPIFPANSYKINHYGFADLFHNDETNQKSLYAATDFNEGDVIAAFSPAAFLKEPSRFTVQVSDDTHIILYPEFLQYINHSCQPNVFFNTDSMKVTCLKKIEPGDEFTFFYPSTEWKMAEPFNCKCGYVDCLNFIQGAKYLTFEIFLRYKFNRYINEKYLPHHR